MQNKDRTRQTNLKEEIKTDNQDLNIKCTLPNSNLLLSADQIHPWANTRKYSIYHVFDNNRVDVLPI